VAPRRVAKFSAGRLQRGLFCGLANLVTGGRGRRAAALVADWTFLVKALCLSYDSIHSLNILRLYIFLFFFKA
jgi:hypothetical protein